MEFTTEQIEKARNCKSLEEFKSLAKAEGLELSDEEANEYFNVTRGGELSDEELSAVAGGGKRPKPKFAVGEWVKITHGGDVNSPNILPYLLTEGEITIREYDSKSKRWIWYRVNIHC